MNKVRVLFMIAAFIVIWSNPLFMSQAEEEAGVSVATLATGPISPSKAFVGDMLDVVIRDENGQFSQEKTSAVDFGIFIKVNSFRVDSPIQITANITVNGVPEETTVSVKVTTAGKVKSCGVFSILFTDQAPVIESIEPKVGMPGEIAIIHGKNFRVDSLWANHVYFNNRKVVVGDVDLDKITVRIPFDFKGGKVTVVAVGEEWKKASNSVDYTVSGVVDLGKEETIQFGQTIEGEIRRVKVCEGCYDFRHERTIDKYTFTAQEGIAVTIMVDRLPNLPNGEGSFNPDIWLYDSENNSVASDDDGGTDIPPGPGKNALIKKIILPKTGIYTIVIVAGIRDEEKDESKSVFDFSAIWGLGPYKVTLIKE